MDRRTLREIRKDDLRLTQAQLGQVLGIHTATICEWETGKCPIGHPKMLALAMAALKHGLPADAP